mmetsp:Transcript_1555/g.5323  ORF Transcript_1555/g.5323 Transcript_1555/m.5323 type:complete len:241 (+) Transcript_1555:2-724(+)
MESTWLLGGSGGGRPRQAYTYVNTSLTRHRAGLHRFCMRGFAVIVSSPFTSSSGLKRIALKPAIPSIAIGAPRVRSTRFFRADISSAGRSAGGAPRSFWPRLPTITDARLVVRATASLALRIGAGSPATSPPSSLMFMSRCMTASSVVFMLSMLFSTGTFSLPASALAVWCSSPCSSSFDRTPVFLFNSRKISPSTPCTNIHIMNPLNMTSTQLTPSRIWSDGSCVKITHPLKVSPVTTS